MEGRPNLENLGVGGIILNHILKKQGVRKTYKKN
jgi:hypothetical protein